MTKTADFEISETREVRLDRLFGACRDLESAELVRAMIGEFGTDIALVSSCGAEAAILVDMVARVDPATPVIFLQTGKMFPETLEYAERLRIDFGLQDFRVIAPSLDDIEVGDPDRELWRRQPDRCCQLRKVEPLEQALAGFGAWMTGIKRYHNFVRRDVPRIDLVDGRFKVSPLADWSPERVKRQFEQRALPKHPLVARGYSSIGCMPCTSPSGDQFDPRAGRWHGLEKTECGIHRPIFGK